MTHSQLSLFRAFRRIAMSAAVKIAPKDKLASLAAVNSLIAEVSALDGKTAAPGGPRVGGSARVGNDSPSLGVDCSWFPAVPLGHTSYTWGSDEADADVKLANVFSRIVASTAGHQHHSHDDKDAAPAAADSKSAKPAAAATTTTAAPAAADAKQNKSNAKTDKKSGGDDANKKSDKKSDKKSGGGGGGKKVEAPKPTAAAGSVPVFARLDIRAGKIVKAWKHPKADKLYIEHIDVGEKEPRTIVSGLVEHIPLAEFEGSTVLVCCNLKPADMRGQMSYGMVLAASNDNRKTVELVQPAAGSKPGDRVSLAGEASTQSIASADKEIDIFTAGNAWIDAKDFLTTDANCHAQYNGKAMVTAAGPARSKSKANGKIS